MSDLDRLKSMLEEVVTAAIERVVVSGDALVYFAEWLYIVEAASPSGYDLRSTDPRVPDLSQVKLWPGPSGGSAIAAPGSQCRVRFLNADRTKPVVVGLDPNTVVSSTIPAQTTVSVGDATARPLAHSLEVEAILAAVLVEANADIAALTNPPTSTTFTLYAPAKATLLTTLVTAITAQLVTLPTVKALGT